MENIELTDWVKKIQEGQNLKIPDGVGLAALEKILALATAEERFNPLDKEEEKEKRRGEIEPHYKVLKAYWEQKQQTLGILSLRQEELTMKIKMTIYFIAEYILGLNNIPN